MIGSNPQTDKQMGLRAENPLKVSGWYKCLTLVTNKVNLQGMKKGILCLTKERALFELIQFIYFHKHLTLLSKLSN